MERRRDGQAMVEYALILVLIAVVVIGALLLLGGQIKSIFTNIMAGLAGR
jgi:pilus assembly protein Flp/PilA